MRTRRFLFRAGIAALLLPAMVWLVVPATAATLAMSSDKLTTFASATAVAASTCTLGASADTFATEEAPIFAFGTLLPESLMVQSRAIKRDARTFVRFDVASCVPSNALVVSASLRLFLTSAPSASRTYEVRRVTAEWAESSLTWNNQPGAAGTATDQVATGTTADVTLSWNVGADVQSFVSGGATNNGWMIRDQIEESGSQQTGNFPSKETTSGEPPPQLVVTYYP